MPASIQADRLVQRIVAGMSANAFGQGVTILVQLASLPLFLSQWDIATYGVWLLLSAFAAYLTMADVGMVTAAGNRMTMAMGAADVGTAERVFHSAILFVAVVCAAIAVVALPLLIWAPLPGLTTPDRHLAAAALVATVLVSLWNGLAEALFRATGRYAQGTLLANLVRLAEWAGSMAGLLWIGSFAAVAIGGLLARAAGMALMLAWSRRDAQGLHWSLAQARWSEVRAMLKPAAWFMAFPLANAMSFQGVTLLVGHLLGPAAVAVFNTYRTLARVTVQLTSVFSHALAPEMSSLLGAGAIDRLRRLYRRAFWLGGGFAVASSVVVYLLSPWLLEAWTHGRIPFDGAVLGVLLAYAAFGSAWHVPRMLLMATNQHAGLALWYVLTAVLGLALAAYGAQVGGMIGVAWSVLAVEVLIAGICTLQARELTLSSSRSTASLAS